MPHTAGATPRCLDESPRNPPPPVQDHLRAPTPAGDDAETSKYLLDFYRRCYSASNNTTSPVSQAWYYAKSQGIIATKPSFAPVIEVEASERAAANAIRNADAQTSTTTIPRPATSAAIAEQFPEETLPATFEEAAERTEASPADPEYSKETTQESQSETT